MRALARDRSLRAQARAFTAGLHPALLDRRRWIPIQFVTCAALLALACLAAWVPHLREFFRLRPTVPLVLVAASAALVFALGLRSKREIEDSVLVAGGALLYVVVDEMALTSFAVYAEPPGAFVLVALPLLRAAFDGIAFGSPAGLAAFTAAHGLGVLAAVALEPGIGHRWLVLLAAPVTMGMFLFFAGAGGRLACSRRLVAQQRAALQAQHALERVERLERATATLRELRERRHAARSALSTARLAADRLTPLVRDDPELQPRAEALLRALGVLEQLVAQRRSPEPRTDEAGGPSLERVEVPPLARRVLEAAQGRVPGLRATARLGSGPPLAALVRGGSPALYQILEHLVTNACEGDGVERARQIELAVDADERAGVLAIRANDDGPGFRPGLLDGPIAPFLTTKPRGVGLGLYTVERLARASGGSLRLENRPEGGAAATVYLELAGAAPPALAAAGGEPAAIAFARPLGVPDVG